MAWKGRVLTYCAISALRNSRLLWKNSRARNLPEGLSSGLHAQLRAHSSRPLLILPWSEILPFGSIRVNLTEAQKEGWIWTLDTAEGFPDLLEGKLRLVSQTLVSHSLAGPDWVESGYARLSFPQNCETK